MYMHKLFLPALLLFCIPHLSLAQAPPTLMASNVSPLPGDEFVIHNCVSNNVQPGTSGANTSWDFSSLSTLTTQGGIDTGLAMPSISTQTYAIFPTSTLAVVTPASNLVTYFIESDTKLSQDGLYVSSSEYTAYSDPMDVLQFPLTYNNTFTDNYSGLVVYTPSGGTTLNAINNGSITVIADAYGTLTLPGASGPVVYQNVLRVHSVQTYRDSVYLFGTTSIVETYNVETYTWYTPGYHNALLVIATSTGPGGNSKQVSYSSRQLAGPEGVSTLLSGNVSVNLYPNPANSELNIAYSTANSDYIHISLYDMLGREIASIANGNTQGAQTLSYNTSALTKGMYLIRFQTKDETITKKVTIQ